MRDPGGELGMTLVEMLIVLAIVGVIAGAASLAIGAAARSPRAEAEARRLAERIQLAADDVMVDDRGLALSVDEKGYGFAAFGPSGWAMRADEALGYHRLPGGMELVGAPGGFVRIGSDGSAAPIALRLRSAAGSWLIRYDGLTASAVPAG